MADWRTISDTEVDPDAPVTSELAYAFRDNVIAAFEGASGAPRLQDAALGQLTTPTAAGRQWVAYRMADATAGNIGSYALARRVAGGVAQFGDVVAGSQLYPSHAGGHTGNQLSGSWQCMGYVSTNTAEATSVSLFLRVS